MASMREKSFGYPKFDENGEKLIMDRQGLYRDMMMDMKSYLMKTGDTREFDSGSGDELAILLLKGKVTFSYHGESHTVQRGSFIKENAVCLHVCRGTRVSVHAEEDAEIFLVATDNEKEFQPVLYLQDDNQVNVACDGLWENTAVRDVRTLFDYNNAPYSNLVLGETVIRPGRWAGYVPHYHKQPEVYYFRMENPDGFGASFVGEEVFKIKDGSFSAVNSDLVHPQAAAPGYPILFVWIIRHLDGDPWVREECHNEAVHQWLLE